MNKMNKTLLIALFFGATNLFAQKQQDSTLVNEISNLRIQISQLQQEVDRINTELDKDYWTYRGIKKETEQKIIEQKKTIDSLNALIQDNSKTIESNTSQFGTEIEKATSSTSNQLKELDNSIDRNQLYWITGTLLTLLLGGLMYLFLGKRIKLSKTDVETQIRNTKQSLEEESVKLDNKLVEILETQLKIKQEEIKVQPISSSAKEDHSLALKVADEVVRMQKNIAKMDSSTKGIKPLSKGIERIQNNFAANGYEMINHMNKEYDERMNIDVINFITDENLSEGNRIITAIIKPQVNFNGVLIQRAQVDVSQN
jgi:hypothetical protein